jgi:hypothetical protein
MANHWFTHLTAFRKSHPGISLSDAMKEAKKTYKPVMSDDKHKKERKAASKRRASKKGGAQADPIDGEGSGTDDALNGAPTSAIKNTGHAVQLAASGSTGAARKGSKKAKSLKRVGAKKGKSRKH